MSIYFVEMGLGGRNIFRTKNSIHCDSQTSKNRPDDVRCLWHLVGNALTIPAFAWKANEN